MPFALDNERMQIRYGGRLLELSRYEYGLSRLLTLETTSKLATLTLPLLSHH